MKGAPVRGLVPLPRPTYCATSCCCSQPRHCCYAQAVHSAQAGASVVEYALVLLFFGAILFGATSFFQSSSEEFYESSSGGLLLPYPPNYIPAPAPTTAAPGLLP
jgi:hypothetical protein